MIIFFKKLKNEIKEFFSFKRINPHDHWGKLLKIFIILCILLILFSLFILYKIKNQEIFNIVPSQTQTNILINEKLLKKVNDSFDQKLLRVKEIKETPFLYKDPSSN